MSLTGILSEPFCAAPPWWYEAVVVEGHVRREGPDVDFAWRQGLGYPVLDERSCCPDYPSRFVALRVLLQSDTKGLEPRRPTNDDCLVPPAVARPEENQHAFEEPHGGEIPCPHRCCRPSETASRRIVRRDRVADRVQELRLWVRKTLLVHHWVVQLVIYGSRGVIHMNLAGGRTDTVSECRRADGKSNDETIRRRTTRLVTA